MADEVGLEERAAKLAALRRHGIEPYDGTYSASHNAPQVVEEFVRLEGQEVSLAGRLMAFRLHGKASFAHLDDGEGRIQLYFRQDTLGEEDYSRLTKLVDIGDILGVRGSVFRTHTGEVTVAVQSYTLLSKALRPLPEKWHGLRDTEIRYRQRYLDFIANPKARANIRLRARLLTLLRDFMNERGYLEVDTPILQPVYGGALAKPFVTYHNALATNLYLRIAPELYLKRLIVGGFPKVFEIGRNFRNEGISATHNPEFTALEVYQAFGDYHSMMVLTEEMFAALAQGIFGTTLVTLAGQEVELAPPWQRLSLQDAFRALAGVEMEALRDLTLAKEYLKTHGIQVEKKLSWASIIDEVLKKQIEPQLIGPVFLFDYPTVLSPLARNKPGQSDWVERFQPILVGIEMGNAFSELADPAEQRLRFQRQAEQREGGDEEAHPMDEDFVTALEFGMPPTGGLGIGLDRLIMLFAQEESLREIIAFPTLRPK
ncbi:MAG: lysine--tRNA ligase [Coprothermobacterota bacterium]|nr:lysine--tRNA ligase [Coprothermobacterota bacterium]